jgi:leucyl-tRNA synthetase
MHKLPVRSVIVPNSAADTPAAGKPYIGEGTMTGSGSLDGKTSSDARASIITQLKSASLGGSHTHYRLNDWLVSRQRYWGAPIPMIHCSSCGTVPVPDDQLPVKLPDNLRFTGRGPSPLASSEAAEWRNVKCPCCQRPAQRDTDTLDTFVDSSWYFLRYLSPHNNNRLVEPKVAAKWMPVDLYVGMYPSISSFLVPIIVATIIIGNFSLCF